jgi:hypothetical protein
MVGLLLLATRRFRAAGWTSIVLALTPIGDVLVVLTWNGPPILAYAMHGHDRGRRGPGEGPNRQQHGDRRHQRVRTVGMRA